MGTITVSETGNPSNSYTGEGLEWTEFIPLVELRDTTGYNIEKDKLPLEKDENDKHVFVDLLTQTNDSKKNETITTLLTALQKPVIPFLIKKGGPDEQWEDDDGYIEIEISQEKDKFVEVKGVTAKIKQKSETTFSDNILAKFGSEIEVEVDITTEESVAFYIRFLANDNEEGYSTGDYDNLFCGCFKVETIVIKSKIYFYSNSDGEFLGEVNSEFEKNRTILVSDGEYKSLENKKFFSLKLEKERLKEEKNKFNWSFKNKGGLPSLGELIHKYPTDKVGAHRQDVTIDHDKYYNQCAIRLSYGLTNSNFNLFSYPSINKTRDGFARSSKGLADWLHNNVFIPEKFKNTSEFNPNSANGIVFLWDKSDGGVSHIDVIYHGQTGSGYYGADEIWYWELK